MAEGDWGGGEERGIDPPVLPRAKADGEPVLLVAPPQAGKERQEARALGSGMRNNAARVAGQATFALVSEEAGELASAGIELVLRGGRPASGGVGKGVAARGHGMTRRCERWWARWKRRDAQLSGADPGVLVYAAVRHASVLRPGFR